MTDWAESDALVEAMPDAKLRTELKRYLRLFHGLHLLQVERLEAMRVRPNDVVVLRQSDHAEPKVEQAMDALRLCFPGNACLVLMPGDKLETYEAPAKREANL